MLQIARAETTSLIQTSRDQLLSEFSFVEYPLTLLRNELKHCCLFGVNDDLTLPSQSPRRLQTLVKFAREWAGLEDWRYDIRYVGLKAIDRHPIARGFARRLHDHLER